MERSELRITIMDENCQWIREQIKVDDLMKAMKLQKWQWTVYICRREDNRWTRIVTDWIITYTKDRLLDSDEIEKPAEDLHRTWEPDAHVTNKWERLGEAYVLQ